VSILSPGIMERYLLSNNFVYILCVFLKDIICIVFTESMLVNLNLQLGYQPQLVEVTTSVK